MPRPVALVTGASRGIGRAIAGSLAAGGARVAVHFRGDRAAAERTRRGLSGSGHLLFQADVSEPRQCQGLIDLVYRSFGRLDVLVNNAGIYEGGNWRKSSYEDWRTLWRRTLATNLDGPAHLSFLAVRRMRRGGRIVNITSRGAFRGEPQAPAYGAAKAGLNSFGQSLAWALAPAGICVYTLAPGWVDTDMTAGAMTGKRRKEILAQHPLGRIASAEEVGSAAAWLALKAPAAMTGCIVDLNGASYLRT